ncbi:hypothetical protein, partial [Candidatus Electronema sp. TJ]|uniref:hypothetical protein n=1 Tax=Candidatus Electronema sp. TJ TaxID=3401573 RepID=UPI003AA9CD77
LVYIDGTYQYVLLKHTGMYFGNILVCIGHGTGEKLRRALQNGAAVSRMTSPKRSESYAGLV